MDLSVALERDAEGRLPVVEIRSSRMKTFARSCVYAVLTLALLRGNFGLFGVPIGLITGVMFIRFLSRTLLGRTLVISEDGLRLEGVLSQRILPWSTIDHFKLIAHYRSQWLTSFIWCFRTTDVPYRDRFVSIGNGWKPSPLALFKYLEWYQAKVRADESRSDLGDDVVRMNLMTEIGMNRAISIIAVLIGGTGLLAYVLVMLLRAIRGH